MRGWLDISCMTSGNYLVGAENRYLLAHVNTESRFLIRAQFGRPVLSAQRAMMPVADLDHPFSTRHSPPPVINDPAERFRLPASAIGDQL